MNLLRVIGASVATLALSGLVQAATIDFSITNVTLNPTGASFVVKATPNANVPAVGAYSANVRFEGYNGGIGSPLTANVTELFNPANFTAPSFGSSTLPAALVSGNVLTYTGAYSGPVGANPSLGVAGADLFKVDVTVPGTFDAGECFTVVLVPEPNSLSPTGIDSNDVGTLGNARICAVPEPASLSLFGVAAGLMGLGLRRRV